MKSQMDIIVTIVAVVLAAGVAFLWKITERNVNKPSPPDTPITTPVAYPQVNIVMSTSLPGGSGGGGGMMGGGGMGGRMGGGGNRLGGRKFGISGG